MKKLFFLDFRFGMAPAVTDSERVLKMLVQSLQGEGRGEVRMEGSTLKEEGEVNGRRKIEGEGTHAGTCI